MTGMARHWPEPVIELLRSASTAEYTTISAAGVPIDTPVLIFPSEGMESFDLSTGLAYPAKAERARRNARTCLLIQGRPDEPIVLAQGFAAVRDSDLQANALRYLSEAAQTLPHNPPWELARQAVWYWTRILVKIRPARLLWWDGPAAMAEPPHRWHAPAGTVYPPSDPAPPGTISKAAKWEQATSWRALAERALARGIPGHLSLIDEDGFPSTVRARSIEIAPEGFRLALPTGLPLRPGKASLTFMGIETFIGELMSADSMRVERTLPIFPMTEDMTQLWEPAPHTRSELMERLLQEVQRRGQPIPKIPRERPEPTEGYRLRMARRARS
jgi:hypothetical protein